MSTPNIYSISVNQVRFAGGQGLIRRLHIWRFRQIKANKPKELSVTKYFKYLVLCRARLVELTDHEARDLQLLLKFFPNWFEKAKERILGGIARDMEENISATVNRVLVERN